MTIRQLIKPVPEYSGQNKLRLSRFGDFVNTDLAIIIGNAIQPFWSNKPAGTKTWRATLQLSNYLSKILWLENPMSSAAAQQPNEWN